MKEWKWKTGYSYDFVNRIIYFGRNSNIQGLKYVFHEEGTHVSRLTWLVLLFGFTGCLYLLLVPVVQRGGSVSVMPDTRYLKWSTKFPGVTVCEKYAPKEVQKKILKDYPGLLDALNFDYRRHIADIVYGRGSCSNAVCSPCGALVPCEVDWKKIISEVHKKCDELITNCHFNNVEFSCCEHFGNVDSEYGQCFSFNILKGPDTDGLQFFVNRSTGPGVLSFHLLSDTQISVHSPEELSTNVLDKKFKFDVRTHLDGVVNYLFSIIEMDNEPVLENEDINIRKCRYGHEIPDLPLHTYQVYSYGACHLARTTEEYFQICHCVHPVRDIRYEDLYCNYTGINCLITYEGNNTNNLYIEVCLMSMGKILKSRRGQHHDKYDGTLVNISMVSLPTLRYQKSLMRTNLDFVVSVGGMVGLFFSASILSFAEIFYLIFRSRNK